MAKKTSRARKTKAKKKPKDGKQLQNLVEAIESVLKPAGYRIETNWLEYDDEGDLLAEFDIQIIGIQENTGRKQLIECRDRPSDGSAPGSWIEQLVGRRQRFGFEMVTAVSTTGFARGARKYAIREGIELREVSKKQPADFSHWLRMETMEFGECSHEIVNLHFVVHPDTALELQEAFRLRMADVTTQPNWNQIALIRTKHGTLLSPMQLFMGAIRDAQEFERVTPNAGPKPVNVTLDLVGAGETFDVETPKGFVRLQGILFQGNLRLIETRVPIATAQAYTTLPAGEVVAQHAAFDPVQINGLLLSLEMHNFPEGGTRVSLRRIDKDP